ncbi:MAG: alcohol dehydrogenase [Candidatus Cloacimonas sp. SDB]|nr:MAG: alcohol dehydrogenase [Candidatus Cloacimonas sp. SDB]
MKAMVLNKICDLNLEDSPLKFTELEKPEPENNEILLKVSCCGVCHTELDEIEGRTSPPVLPIILGHQVVGDVVSKGKKVKKFNLGTRVGVAWIYSACGICQFCLSGHENLCSDFKATGRDANGGYAEYMTVPEDFAYRIPDTFSDQEAAPLLCAGAIGYRSLQLTGLRNGQDLGLTGFGGSGHLVLKMMKQKFPDSRTYVFARNLKERKFAMELGAAWAGDTADFSPVKLQAVIDTTPAWRPVVEALKNLLPGGRLVVNAIRKEANDQDYLTRINYQEHLWLEKEIKSVANVTRKDVEEFLQLAAEIPLKPEFIEYKLEDANTALRELKRGKIRGAKVLVIE